MSNLTIEFGCLSDPLEKQLKEQGFVDKRVGKHQKVMESISMLHLHNYLTYGQCRKMREKLFKEIKENIEEDK